MSQHSYAAYFWAWILKRWAIPKALPPQAAPICLLQEGWGRARLASLILSKVVHLPRNYESAATALQEFWYGDTNIISANTYVFPFAALRPSEAVYEAVCLDRDQGRVWAVGNTLQPTLDAIIDRPSLVHRLLIEWINVPTTVETAKDEDVYWTIIDVADWSDAEKVETLIRLLLMRELHQISHLTAQRCFLQVGAESTDFISLSDVREGLFKATQSILMSSVLLSLLWDSEVHDLDAGLQIIVKPLRHHPKPVRLFRAEVGHNANAPRVPLLDCTDELRTYWADGLQSLSSPFGQPLSGAQLWRRLHIRLHHWLQIVWPTAADDQQGVHEDGAMREIFRQQLGHWRRREPDYVL